MEIIDPIIRFTGTLLGRNQEEINGVTLKAEYFNLATNSWETIIPEMEVDAGNFNQNIDLALDEFKTNEIYQPIYNALEMGNMPMTRVSLAEVDPDMPAQVVGLGGIVNLQLIEDKNDITIDFGTLYYLDPFAIQQGNIDGELGLTYSLVTLPEPGPIEGNELFPALQAALNQTERFGEFTVDGHTVYVRPNDEELEDCEGAIREITDLLAERDEELENERAIVSDLENALLLEKENASKLSNTLEIEQAKVFDLTRNYEREKAKLIQMTGFYELEVAKVLELEKALILEQGKVSEYIKALEFEKAQSAKITLLLEAEKAHADALEADVTECRIDVDRLEEEKIDILSRDATPANEVYKSIVNELEVASEESIGGRFSVSNLSLNLKTHVINDGDGFKLQLIDSARADYVQDGTISEVQLDIISQEPADATPPILIMPKITGLTETATRKRLTAFGLVLKPIYQASTTMTIGQAFKQTPGAGEEINVGDTITVIFAKDTENFN